MTHEKGRELAKRAHKSRQEGSIVEAGDRFTSAAFEYLGESELQPRSAGSHAMLYLLLAATCYRIGGSTSKLENRCSIGVKMAKEFGDEATSGPPPSYDYDSAERGVWYEFAGDFQVVGQPDPKTVGYEDAIEVYEAAGDPRISLAEQIPMRAIEYFSLVYRSAGKNIDQFREHKQTDSFTEWLKFKQSTLPECLSELDESGQFNCEGE